MLRFEKLDVWHEAIAFAERVYELTRRFPDDERFGITSQMRRAAVSVSSNIAEGCGRPSDVEYARFIGIAYGSLMEIVSQTHLAVRLRYLRETDRESLSSHAERLSRMLSGLRASLARRTTPSETEPSNPLSSE